MVKVRSLSAALLVHDSVFPLQWTHGDQKPRTVMMLKTERTRSCVLSKSFLVSLIQIPFCARISDLYFKMVSIIMTNTDCPTSWKNPLRFVKYTRKWFTLSAHGWGTGMLSMALRLNGYIGILISWTGSQHCVARCNEDFIQIPAR